MLLFAKNVTLPWFPWLLKYLLTSTDWPTCSAYNPIFPLQNVYPQEIHNWITKGKCSLGSINGLQECERCQTCLATVTSESCCRRFLARAWGNSCAALEHGTWGIAEDQDSLSLSGWKPRPGILLSRQSSHLSRDGRCQLYTRFYDLWAVFSPPPSLLLRCSKVEVPSLQQHDYSSRHGLVHSLTKHVFFRGNSWEAIERFRICGTSLGMRPCRLHSLKRINFS